MLGSHFAVTLSLTDGPLESVEPEVVVGSLIRLGEAWKRSVTRFLASFGPGLTASEAKGQCGGLAGEVDAHKRHDELVKGDFPVVDEL